MKTALVLTTVVVVTGFAGFQQHQRLELLKSELVARRSSKSQSQPLTRDQSSSRHSQEIDIPADAGESSITEVLALLHSMGTQKGVIRTLPDREDPAAIRLNELLSSMGLNTASKMIGAIDDPSLRETAMIELSNSNPRVAFLVGASSPSPKAGSWVTPAFLFKAWALVDPAGAVRWLKDREAAHDSIATDSGIRLHALVAEARIDPARSVSDLLALLQNPSSGPAESIASELSDSFHGNSERLQFLTALNEASKDASQTQSLAGFRASLLKQFTTQLRSEPFSEASSLVDGAYTPEEKQLFAAELAQSLNLASKRTQQWLPWLAAIHAPEGAEHPLVMMAKQRAMMGKLGDPEWLDQIPEGELRDQVIVACVLGSEHDPALATRFLAKLPGGPEKEKLTARLESPPEPDGAETGVGIGPVIDE